MRDLTDLLQNFLFWTDETKEGEVWNTSIPVPDNIVDIYQMMLDLSQLKSLGCSKKMEKSLLISFSRLCLRAN